LCFPVIGSKKKRRKNPGFSHWESQPGRKRKEKPGGVKKTRLGTKETRFSNGQRKNGNGRYEKNKWRAFENRGAKKNQWETWRVFKSSPRGKWGKNPEKGKGFELVISQ